MGEKYCFHANIEHNGSKERSYQEFFVKSAYFYVFEMGSCEFYDLPADQVISRLVFVVTIIRHTVVLLKAQRRQERDHAP